MYVWFYLISAAYYELLEPDPQELNELDELQIQLRADWISSGLTGSAAQCLH